MNWFKDSGKNLKWAGKEVFTGINIFIILLNALFFITVLVIFFWFIVSNQFETIILDKVDIVTLLAKNNPSIYNYIKDYVNNNNIEDIKNISDTDKQTRDKNNVKLFINHMIWWFAVLGILCLIVLLYLVIKGKGITTGDIVLILLVSVSFTTEIILFFVLIKPWKFIGDFQLMKSLAKENENS